MVGTFASMAAMLVFSSGSFRSSFSFGASALASACTAAGTASAALSAVTALPASSADARLTLRIAVGLDIVTPVTKAAADMDGDVYVSSADARLVLRTSVGLEPAPKQVRKFLYEIAAYQNA